MYKPNKTTYATLHLTDIAGLIKGSASGAGLGNAFLDNIRRADGIFHVVKLFKDEDEELEDPIKGIEIIREELRLKDLEILSKKTKDRSPLIQKLKEVLEQNGLTKLSGHRKKLKLSEVPIY